MKNVFAVGGSVIKTAYEEIKTVAHQGKINVLIHNGASIFHDFQRTTETLDSHSHSLSKLVDDYEVNRAASELVWDWVKTGKSPSGSLTHICQRQNIPILLFTALGTDFWQLFSNDWERVARISKIDFQNLVAIMRNGSFHFISMGSAVIHPEIFIKALAVSKTTQPFRADVVDFLNMYRPRTRVAIYGKYYQMEFKEYLNKVIKDEITVGLF